MSRTVLLVEKEEWLRRVLAAVLVGEGYAVEAAADGGTALERLEARLPDLIVLDLTGPGADGAGLVEALDRCGLRPAVPVVIVTGEDGPGGSLPVKADGHVAEPIDLPALLAEVDRLAPPGRAALVSS